jgi:serine phosphatase RsbU (regulator of sigma subunit)
MAGGEAAVTTEQDIILAELLDALDAAPAATMLDTTFLVLRKHLPIRSLGLYVADYSEDRLLLVPASVAPPPGPADLAVRGTVAGRVYLNRESVVTEGDEGRTLWSPVHRRSDSVGVLAIVFDDEETWLEELTRAIALAVGAAVLGARRHSDVFELARGADELGLAATMQWDLLPLPNYVDPRFEVAGRVEPAYDIGGDAFDFAANQDVVEIGVFDAMGHGLRSTLLTTLTVGAYRFGRRRRDRLVDVAADVDEAVLNDVAGEAFVTGHLCRLDLATGVLSWLNAGHPVPLLIRDHSAGPIGEAEPVLPFGLEGTPQPAVEVGLQPEDIVLFYSDGVIEARPEGGPEFGMERFLDLAGRHGDVDIALVVLVRLILDDVVRHAAGVLRDDATLVAVRWTGARSAP